MADIPYSTLYSLIKRDSVSTSSETINKIAKALNVPAGNVLFASSEEIKEITKPQTEKTVEQLSEILETTKEKMYAFMAIMRAVGYDFMEEYIDGGYYQTFFRTDGTWSHRIPKKDLGDMMDYVLSYAECICLAEEKKLKRSDAQLTSEPYEKRHIKKD